ncbi:MAG TPA: AMP-binding protein, partial [Candidatus Binataceae bacterium]|nr:AMP-binding protein [Candidatus Binataceae bacterium]
MNTVNFITIPAAIAPDQEILVCGEKRLSYATLNETAARLAAVLRRLGLHAGDVVAALDTNSDLYVASYYAAARAGLTFLPLNYRARESELEYMLNTAGARVLLAGDRYLELAARLRPRLHLDALAAIGHGSDQAPSLATLIETAA